MSSSIIKDLGEHPEDKKPVRVMKGQYGPYIKYKSLNATIPGKRAYRINYGRSIDSYWEKKRIR